MNTRHLLFRKSLQHLHQLEPVFEIGLKVLDATLGRLLVPAQNVVDPFGKGLILKAAAILVPFRLRFRHDVRGIDSRRVIFSLAKRYFGCKIYCRESFTQTLCVATVARQPHPPMFCKKGGCVS